MKDLLCLYDWLEAEGVYVFDRRLPFTNKETKAATVQLDSKTLTGIFLDKSQMNSTADEYSTMLHESGHYATGATHKLSSPLDLIEKHEYKANKWAVKNFLTESALDEAVAEGNTELWQLAEYFGVTEDLMKKAVCYYTYGNLAADLYF